MNEKCLLAAMGPTVTSQTIQPQNIKLHILMNLTKYIYEPRLWLPAQVWKPHMTMFKGPNLNVKVAIK